MPVLMTTAEFAEECAQRRSAYDAMFERPVTPAWLKKFEDQVLNECRVSLSHLDDPNWKRIFEMRVEIMNAERDRS